jgi:hypothetical protein
MSAGGSQGLPGPASGQASHESGPAREAAFPDDTMARFAGYVVNRLFSIGLSLDSAHSIAGIGPAGDRVAAAADEVDRLIRGIRDYVFAERTEGTPVGLPWKTQLDDQERAAQTADRVALLEERIASGPCIAGERGGLRGTTGAKGQTHQAA